MSKIDKVLSYLILAAIVFIVVNVVVARSKENKRTKQPEYEFCLTIDEVKAQFPKADRLFLKDTSLYYVYDSQGKEIGKVLNTSPYNEDIIGYGGTIPITVFLDERNRITHVEVCENKETPRFINGIIKNGFLESWNGLTPEQVVDKQVDAVSGATFSSTAIIQSMRYRMSVLSRQEQPEKCWDWNLFVRQICVLIIMTLALICFFNPQKTKTLRLITLLLSVVVLGFWTNSLLSLALFYNMLTNGIPCIVQIPIIIIALLAVILPLITGKSFYCQYLCPFGVLQEFAGKINRRKVKISAKAFKVILIIRKLILLAIIVITALGVGLNLLYVEPFSAFHWQSVGFGMVTFAVVILITSVFITKPWCSFLCPTGLLLEMIRKIRK